MEDVGCRAPFPWPRHSLTLGLVAKGHSSLASNCLPLLMIRSTSHDDCNKLSTVVGQAWPLEGEYIHLMVLLK